MRRAVIYTATVSLINMAANLIVVATVQLFLQSYTFSSEMKAYFDYIQMKHPVVNDSLMIASFIVPTVIVILYIWPVIRALGSRASLSERKILKAKRRLLNSTFIMALISYSGWSIGFTGHLVAVEILNIEIAPHVTFEIILNMLVMSTFTFTIVYYSLDLVTRSFFTGWMFNQHEKLSQYKSLNLSITSRLLILYTATGILPVMLLSAVILTGGESGYIPQPPELIIMITVILLTGITATLLMAYTYSPILRKLRRAAISLGRSDFNIQVPVVSNDETGILAETLNEAATSLQEKEFINETFGKVVDPVVRDHLLRGNVDLGGNTVTATVLFSDIRGFTEISEKLSAAAVVSLLNRYFSVISRCVSAEGGMVNKFIGDAIMAVFNTPVDHEFHASAAVKAALAMQRARDSINRELAAENLPQIKSGFGIHTGEVVAGNIGSESRMEFTVIGDTVNTASRLEGACKKLNREILLSEACVEKARSENIEGIGFEALQKIEVKGKSEQLQVFTIAGTG